MAETLRSCVDRRVPAIAILLDKEQNSAQGILIFAPLQNPNSGPNFGKQILDAQMFRTQILGLIFCLFFQQKRPPNKIHHREIHSQKAKNSQCTSGVWAIQLSSVCESFFAKGILFGTVWFQSQWLRLRVSEGLWWVTRGCQASQRRGADVCGGPGNFLKGPRNFGEVWETTG